ncbi:unnamed protein product [Rhizoctonia solani]|uniref:Uncharacterized protein n=1 Tax=Rhizoctonia solani TaxID=456999 RepID=A0A8H3DBE3_9AGAM|nr:unnamed protein product [Rhizoctonia solani]
MADGKREIQRTSIERLMTRKAKYLHVREHGHLFGDKYDCYFNPYSHSQVNEVSCKRIVRPYGLHVGRGGPDRKPIHELIGLRDDYDFWLDIPPTAAEVRRETKVVEREEACDKALGASKDKAGAKHAAPPKGKERKNASVSHRSKRDHVEVDDEESNDGTINRRDTHTLTDSASKSDTARKTTKGALKNTGKKVKPTKSAGRKDQVSQYIRTKPRFIDRAL